MSDRQREEALEAERKAVVERQEERGRRMGIERMGFAEGGWEREVLERELGAKPGEDADGRGKEGKIGRNRRT